MNPTVMEVCSQKGPAPQAPAGPEVLTGEFFDRIINIAGIGAGDTVVYLGGKNDFIETLLCSRGIRIQMAPTSPANNRLRKPQHHPAARADAILWYAEGFTWSNPSQTLAYLRQCLKPGGRLVLCRSSCNCRSRQARQQAMERLLATAGFVSVIVGRLPGHAQDAAVATGVLGKKRIFDTHRR